MIFDTNQISWFEDGQLMEYYVGDGRPEDRKCRKCILKEAIQFAWENKMCLYIQPELQDSGLFADFAE